MTNRKSVFHGAILTVSMRWTDRLIGLVSMVILARLLTPADFGIVAMASIVVGLIDVLLDLGVNIALIHKQDADREDYDTAWTIRLIQACLAGSLVFLLAPLAADYYNNPLVIDVLRVMALSIILVGLENIGVVTFQKNMEFGNDFRFFFYKRVSGFLVTLVAAWLLQTYWAMVIGTLASRVIGVMLSYGMHNYRPKLCLARFTNIWSFSQWVLIRNIGGYMNASTDRLLVGGRTNAGETGAYAVANEIAAMPTTELLAPLGRVLFPAFVNKRDDPVNFAQSVVTALGVQALVAIPACVGLALVAEDAIALLLGEQWSQAVPLVQVMAVTNLIIALTHSGGYSLLATGKVKLLALLTWLNASLFLACAILLFPQSGPSEIAEIRLAVAVLGMLVLTGVVLKNTEGLRVSAYFGVLVRPFLAAGLMASILLYVHPLLTVFVPLIRLLFEISLGGIVYVSGVVLMWLIMAKPAGAEAYLLKNVMHNLKSTEKAD